MTSTGIGWANSPATFQVPRPPPSSPPCWSRGSMLPEAVSPRAGNERKRAMSQWCFIQAPSPVRNRRDASRDLAAWIPVTSTGMTELGGGRTVLRHSKPHGFSHRHPCARHRDPCRHGERRHASIQAGFHPPFAIDPMRYRTVREPPRDRSAWGARPRLGNERGRRLTARRSRSSGRPSRSWPR